MRKSLFFALTLVAPVMLASCSKPAPTSEPPSATAAALTQPAGAANAKPAAIGVLAPDFTLTDLDGKEHALSALKGKIVVLEWFNPGCPFVVKAHEEGSLKEMAKRETAAGVVWLAINSGAPGKQGHGAEVNKAAKQKFGMDHPILLDETGRVGRLYGAERTPHMYVIAADGTLVYRGAIDSTEGGDPEPDEKVTNYVEQALGDLRASRAVAMVDTKAFGCSVKYP